MDALFKSERLKVPVVIRNRLLLMFLKVKLHFLVLKRRNLLDENY